MPHLPGLDGLRGLAVIGVLLFHGGFTWAGGGYLGVSTFFTLSGFLITNLLVREFDARHTIGLARFWTRRFRRLLPAALLAIALIGVLWWRVGSPEQLADLHGDMNAALGYVANWRFLSAGTSYADLFSAPSPLQHFWSLAIEEQFYLVFPLVVIAVMKLGGRRLLTGVLAAATAASVLATLVLRDNLDRVYYGTDTRAAELLIGALLAVWWSGRPTTTIGRHARTTSPDTRGPSPLIDAAGFAALAAMFWAWWAIAQTDNRLTHGALPLYAVGTAVIIYAATQPGAVTRLLSFAPLRGAGLISYGLYLYHWPIFLLLDDNRLHWPTLPLFALRMAVTTAIALASYHLLEMPIRRGTLITTSRAALTAGLAGALIVASTAYVVTLDPPRSTVAFGDRVVGDLTQTVEIAPPATTSTTAVASATTTTDAPVDFTLLAALAPIAPVTADTVLLLGDSGMLSLGPPLTAALEASGTSKVIQGAALGFGLTPPFPWRDAWTQSIAENQPDLVIMMMGGWDANFVEEQGKAAYLAVVDEAVAILSQGRAHILWLPMMPGMGKDTSGVDAVYAELPARYPGVVRNPLVADVLRGPTGDYPKYLFSPDGSTLVLRGGDGWHLCQDGGALLTESIMTAAARRGWSSPPVPGWETGSWRDQPAYDDPPGGCDPP